MQHEWCVQTVLQHLELKEIFRLARVSRSFNKLSRSASSFQRGRFDIIYECGSCFLTQENVTGSIDITEEIPRTRLLDIAKLTHTIMIFQDYALTDAAVDMLQVFLRHCRVLDLFEMYVESDFARVLGRSDFPNLECLGLGAKTPSLYSNKSFPSLRVLAVDAGGTQSVAKHRSTAEVLLVKTWSSTRTLNFPKKLGITKLIIDICPKYMSNFQSSWRRWKAQITDFIMQESISNIYLPTEMRGYPEFFAEFECNVEFLEQKNIPLCYYR